MTTPWSDTPPTEEKQRYWVRRRESETEEPGWLENDQWLFSWPFERWFPADFPEQFQFGPRVLSAEETVKLTAEVERLRAAVEKPPLGITSPMRLEPNDDDFPTIPFEVVQRLKCVPAEELEQLRADAAELAEIKRAWGMAAKDL